MDADGGDGGGGVSVCGVMVTQQPGDVWGKNIWIQ